MAEHNHKRKPAVSVIIPAHNEEQRITTSLDLLAVFCEVHFDTYEIICVDDGSTDRTWQLLSQRKPVASFRALQLPKNSGKGFAVKYGMLNASGHIRFYTDADLPYDIDAFTAALSTFERTGCDIVIGTRELSTVSNIRSVGIRRQTASRLFSALVKCLVDIDINDTQCGFKGFTETAVSRIFPRLKTAGYAFDVEVFTLSQRMKLNVRKIPVTYRSNSGSKIRLARDPFSMLLDLFRIAHRVKFRQYVD